jgi:hypothetical protein
MHRGQVLTQHLALRLQVGRSLKRRHCEVKRAGDAAFVELYRTHERLVMGIVGTAVGSVDSDMEGGDLQIRLLAGNRRGEET